MPYERELLDKLIIDYKFEEEYSIKCLEANRHNHVTATYHLINKRNKKSGINKSTTTKKESEPVKLSLIDQ